MKKILLIIVLLFMIQVVYGAAPVLNSITSPQNLTEGQLYTYIVVASDPENGILSFSDDTDNFDISAINNTDAEISFTPTNAMVGSFIAVIIVRDEESLVAAQAINFTVNGLPNFTNLENKNITVGEELYYDINATDPEDGIDTVDSSNLNFFDNSSLFEINISTGVINFTATLDNASVYYINITVNDTKNAIASEIIEFAVNDYPNITGSPTGNATEDENFQINLSDWVNNSVGALIFSHNTTLFTINPATGIVNFTPTNNTLGIHKINLTVVDAYDLLASGIWTLNVTAANDAPNFSQIANQTGTVNKTFFLDINATDEEGDEIYYLDNSSFFTINSSDGIIDFTINDSMLGTNIINITVNDTLGNIYSDTFILQVNINRDPIFPKNITTALTPTYDTYVDEAYGSTTYNGNEFLELSDVTGSIKRTYLNFDLTNLPSSSTIFLATLNLTINSSLAGTELSVFRINSSWIESSLTFNNHTKVDNSTMVNFTSLTVEDSFNVVEIVKGWFNGSFSNYGFYLRMVDETANSGTIKYYSSDSSNSSNWPSLYITHNASISDQSVSSGGNLTDVFDLDDYFYDADGDALTYNATSTSLVNVVIAGDGQVNISTIGSNTGSETVTFSANDGISTVNSNVVTITITSVSTSPSSSSSSSSSSGGGGGSSRKTAALSITFDSNRETIKEGELVQIPVILENTGEVNLRNIDLALKVDNPGLNLALTNNFVSTLDVGDKSSLTLIINSADALLDSYVISLNANTVSPNLEESAVFVLDVLTEGKEIGDQITQAQDLFKNNPECLELQELVEKAEEQLNQGDYINARKNIALAIESCRNMIRIQEPSTILKKKWPLSVVLISLAIVTLGVLITYTFLKRKK